MNRMLLKKLLAALLAALLTISFTALPASAYVESYTPETSDTGTSDDSGEDENLADTANEEEGEDVEINDPEGEGVIEEELPSTSGKFSDVPSSAFYYDAVAWAVDKGVTSGTGGGKFSPKAACTRAQAVTFLWRAAGEPEPAGSAGSFSDVSSGAYYAKAVRWAVENGVTSGTGGGKFSPNSPCSRAQIVTFLYRAADSPSVSGGNSFSDVPSGQYYAKAVKWAVDNNITSGTGGGKFSPNATCNRGQIVTFLYRYAG